MLWRSRQRNVSRNFCKRLDYKVRFQRQKKVIGWENEGISCATRRGMVANSTIPSTSVISVTRVGVCRWRHSTSIWHQNRAMPCIKQLVAVMTGCLGDQGLLVVVRLIVCMWDWSGIAFTSRATSHKVPGIGYVGMQHDDFVLGMARRNVLFLKHTTSAHQGPAAGVIANGQQDLQRPRNLGRSHCGGSHSPIASRTCH